MEGKITRHHYYGVECGMCSEPDTGLHATADECEKSILRDGWRIVGGLWLCKFCVFKTTNQKPSPEATVEIVNEDGS